MFFLRRPLCCLRRPTMSTFKALQHLYSLGASSPDLLPHLYFLIRNDDEEKYLTGLRGPDLSRLVNFLDEVCVLPLVLFELTNQGPQALDTAPITDDVSRRCLHKLQAICGKRRTLPSSYVISGNLSTDGDKPVASGGFSDVWQGIYDERRVCIKRLRTTQQNRRVVERVCLRFGIFVLHPLRDTAAHRGSARRQSCGSD